MSNYWPPTTSNVVYSTPFGSPLPENDCHHILLAKTEPRRLGLGFWPQLGPPLRLTPSLAPTTLNLVYFTPIGPPLPENKCPHVSLAKTEPGGSVLDFGSNSAPLRIARSHPTTTSNPVNPTKIRSTVPENQPPAIICENQAPADFY